MAGIYQTFADAASQLLTGPLGGKGKLRRKSGGGYDDNGDPVPVSQRDIPVGCVVKDKAIWNAGAYMGSKLVAVLDNRVAPLPDDELTVGTSTYTIVQVTPKAPTGIVISYEVELR